MAFRLNQERALSLVVETTSLQLWRFLLCKSLALPSHSGLQVARPWKDYDAARLTGEGTFHKKVT